jgi:alkylated DNA repair dioxygenase AlkB
VGTLFDLSPAWPEGFRFERELVTLDEETAMLKAIETLTFRPVVMRGVPSRRRVVQLGQHYSFGTRRLTPAPPIPDVLLPLRARAAALTDEPAEVFVEALVTEYAPGAGIGWHRDAPPFGVIVGVSLLGSCTLNLRPRSGRAAPLAIELTPRSAYVFSDVVRRDWDHRIPPTRALRYSITFRTLAR